MTVLRSATQGALLSSRNLYRHEMWRYANGELGARAAPLRDASLDAVYGAGNRDTATIIGNKLGTPATIDTEYDPGTGPQPVGCVGVYTPDTGWADGVMVDVTANYLGDLSNIGAQVGPVVHHRSAADPGDTAAAQLGMMFAPDITIGASVGGAGLYLHTVQREPFTIASGLAELNLCAPASAFIHLGAQLRIIAAGGKVAGYVRTWAGGWDRIAGPLELDTWAPYLIDVPGAGVWLCDGDGTPLAPDGGNMTIRRYVGADLGSHPPAPSAPVLGAGNKASAAGSIAIAYGAHGAGELIIAVVLCSTTAGLPAAPAGWTRQAVGGSGAGRTGIYTRDARATGTESGTVTFTAASGTPDMAGRMFSIPGANPWARPLGIAVSYKSSTADASMPHAGGQLFGPNERFVWLGACPANEAITPPAGFTDHGQLALTGAALNLCVASRAWGTTGLGRIDTGAQNGSRVSAGTATTALLCAMCDPR